MDKVIEAARALGKAIQADERYMRYNVSQQKNDEDTQLQELIKVFSKKRDELTAETQNENRDNDKVAALNAEVREAYAEIFANENMMEFSTLRDEFQTLINYVNQIITASSNGEDPETFDYQAACSGSCSSCSGCH